MKSILRRLRHIHGTRKNIFLPDEIFLPALEERWSVLYRNTESRKVQARCNGSGVLKVSGPIQNVGEVKEGFRRWLVRQAGVFLVSWLDELSLQTGMSYERVSVRGQKTRWASCSSKGTISINYRMLFLPPDVVRYILIHELCHTIHPNHSGKFWSTVALLEPDFKTLNDQAKRGMEKVPEWAKDW